MGNRESSKRPHEGLEVWQDAMRLVETVYRLSSRFPASERFGLTIQVRRAAVSIPSNIAEGAARRSTPEYLRFLSIARGSLSELDTQMQIAVRLNFIESPEAADQLIDRVFAKVTALMKALESTKKSRSTRNLLLNDSPFPIPDSHAR